MSRRFTLKALSASVALASFSIAMPSWAADTIKVGILHSAQHVAA